MAPPRSVITLTTDFGTADPFVAVMKGMILSINPEAILVDITHEVPPQSVEEAAYHLSNAWRHFPRGTVHVAVVDPGVGSSRRALAVAAEGHLFLAPDNGLLTPIFESEAWRAFAITERHYMAPSPAPTFHGRDVFAPAAAHAARGSPIDNFGEPVSDPAKLPLERPRVAGTSLQARVLHVDRFGNVILNVEGADLSRILPEAETPRLVAEIAGRRVDRLVTHYAAAEGALCFLINSDGRLEIALPGGSAAAALGLLRGAEVVLRTG